MFIDNAKSNSKKPIGVFDSGIGGLTVIKALISKMPNEDFVYFGDTARLPYGTKSKKTVTRFSIENSMFLLTHKVKAIVVACNSASSLALVMLRKIFYTIPVIDVISPGVNEAVKQTKTNRVGVIGTRATISSGIYEKMLKKANPSIKVFSQDCGLFVPLVEEGWGNSEISRKVAEVYLRGLRSKNIDTLILGCTHYPLLKEMIQDVIGRGVRLVDSPRATALEAFDVLNSMNLISNKKSKGEQKYFVSDNTKQFKKLGERFLGKELGNVKIVDTNIVS